MPMCKLMDLGIIGIAVTMWEDLIAILILDIEFGLDLMRVISKT